MTQPLDAIGTAQAIRRGEVSAREVVEQAIAGFEKHADLNLLTATRYEEALADVDAGLPVGPLTGSPDGRQGPWHERRRAADDPWQRAVEGRRPGR
ncbi:hypothetical protein [Nocardioides alcanivorans]|uniref:hypothetical protein n=1 Tax=Nocardioides alcanivorans TaxID=2897352 RepID=UPI001F289227|nr:hypothetical protein [Nocardioides alcanivorans]